MGRDPVCGMHVDEEHAAFKVEQGGKTYYFCSEGCMLTFQQPDVELKKLRNLAIFSLILGLWLMVIMFVHEPPFFSHHIWGLLLATPVQFVAGYRYYRGAWGALKARTANMDTLIVIGTTTAWGYSTFVVLFPHLAPSMEVYFDASAMILALILVGKYLEEVARGRASEAVRKLLDLQPPTATVVKEDGSEEIVGVETIMPMDILRVKPGEKIALDGILTEGASSIDESMITGESIPVSKKVGDEVIGGTINREGSFKMEVTKIGMNTTLQQIVQMVEEAQLSKAPIQRLADVVAAYFTPAVLIIATSAFLGWYYVAHSSFGFAFTAFVAVVIVACPCAMGIATPTAILVGAGLGAQNGILIKNGEFLEKARSLQAVAFDKTGTLTKGEIVVTDVYGNDSDKLLAEAASLEKLSEHPIGAAVVKHAQDKGLILFETKNFEALAGRGIKGTVNGNNYVIGTSRLMTELNIDTTAVQKKADELYDQGKTLAIVAMNGVGVGLIGVADELKDNAKEAVKRLKEMGLKVVMITGDNKRTAAAIAKQVGIDEYVSEVLPEDKVKEIQKLKENGFIVGMVGDGVNDAPALAESDVGIALGSGTDVALETGGIVLIRNNLMDVPTAIELSKRTYSKIVQNLFWAFFYNTALIPVAAGILIPWGIQMNPIFAAGAMALSSFTVVINSLLLRRWKPRG
ncbi:heavy metal translocating P-type ATPase [Candidatus Bathyarchaeota archaeon]|nr:heavy metal translocating P-type ATPase [Candidatus Bathyarchaeota archaeon]